MTCNICKIFENIGSFIVGCTNNRKSAISKAQNTTGPQDQLTSLFSQESMVTTDKEVQTAENASGAVSTMPTSSLISNSNSVTDDSDKDHYVSDEDYDYFDRVKRATGAFSEFSNQDR